MGSRLRFAPDDDEAYERTRDELLAELESWAQDVDRGVTPDDASEAELLLDWRVQHSTGELDRFDVGDLEDYLLGWCPARVAVPAEDWPGIVAGARAWVLFLVSTGRWSGGPVRPVLRGLDRLQPRFLQEMGDPANHGLGKSILGVAAPGGLDLDDPDALRAAIDAFNALPFEERARLTGGVPPGGGPFDDLDLDDLFDDDDEDEDDLDHDLFDLGDLDDLDDLEDILDAVVDLPLTPAPDRQRAALDAAEAPIVRHFEALRRHLGQGVALTAKGNPKLVDARALVDALETDDLTDQRGQGRGSKLHSADQLPHLRFLLRVATEAGAVRRHRGKLVPVAAWERREPIDQVRACFTAALDLGPLSARYPGGVFDEVDELCEDGLLPWLAVVFAAGEVEVDDLLVELVQMAGPTMSRGSYRDQPDLLRRVVGRGMGDVLDVAERCGLVTWTGHHLDEGHGGPVRVGGSLHVTELGRLLLPEFLPAVGYRAHSEDELAELSAHDVVARLCDGGGPPPEAVWAAWRPEERDVDKAAAVVDVLAGAERAEERIIALGLLAAAPEAAAGPLDALADGPLGGHVALFLLDQGLADESRSLALEPEARLLPLVDALSSSIEDDPEELVAYFDEAVPPEARSEVLPVMARVATAETAEVLDVLGRLHPDRATAKAARKAAMQHRSRSVNAR